jgi:galactokinase
MGDHTDYTGGLVLPMAVDLETVVEGVRGGDRVVLRSADEPGVADVPLDVGAVEHRALDSSAFDGVEPAWARFVAAVVGEVGPAEGLRGRVGTTIPLGAGLSSSTALVVAVALALGFEGSPRDLALACQRAEIAATGVAGGVMDQLASAAGVPGHAMLIDCATLEITPVVVPDGVDVVVVHSGQRRALAATAYAERRAECDAAAALIGPLREADIGAAEAIADPVLRRRARHVVTENVRVMAMASALDAGDSVAAGALMDESHASLASDFEVSTPALDALVTRLAATPGVLGARLTGAGFGGCVVALAEPNAAVDGWRLQAAAGATVEVD